MTRIYVELDATDALLALGALDARSAAAHREARRLAETGQHGSPEHDIATTTAAGCDRVGDAIRGVLYPPQVPKITSRILGDWADW